MIEIPESATIGKQASETLKGKRIAHVIESNSPHRFTFYNGDPAEYSNRLVGRTVLGAKAMAHSWTSLWTQIPTS